MRDGDEMSDTYDAIYQATRSKITGCDVGSAIQDAMNNMNISFYAERASQTIQEAAMEYTRPSVLFKPELTQDGDHWIALFGVNLQVGAAGFGKSPSEAMYDFDKKWSAKLP